LFEKRLGVNGRRALRIEKVRFTGREGVTSQGCPIAKWVIRRSNQEEKYCIIVKNRYGHQCEYAWIAVSLIQWDGLPKDLADKAYEQMAHKTANYGSETERMCGANKKKTCACQGQNSNFNGASYTFGCSWTMYQNVCKFCRSSDVHKFRLKDGSEEINLDMISQKLTDSVSPTFKRLAPDCYNNMCLFEEVATDCRIGTKPGRPFSGITTVCDYCAHSHKDNNNMIGGCTVVVTLTRPENRTLDKVDDEQYHVLPQYVPDATPEEVQEKMASGGLEVLSKFKRTITIREKPKKPNCKRGRPSAEKKKMMDGYIPKDYTDEKNWESPKGKVRSSSGSPASGSPKGRGISLSTSLSISDTEASPRTIKVKKPKEIWTTSPNKIISGQQKTIKLASVRPINDISTNYSTQNIHLNDMNDLDTSDIDYSYNNQTINQTNSHLKKPSFPSNNWNTSSPRIQNTVIKSNVQHQPSYNIQNNRQISINSPIRYKSQTNYNTNTQYNSSITPTAQKFTTPHYAQSQNTYFPDQSYGQQDQSQYLPNISQMNSELRQQPRKIVISNPIIYRAQETQPYIPRVPNIQSSHRPTDVSKTFISNIEAQFSDSILELLDEPLEQPNNNQQTQPEQTASLIYANYLNNLPQVDGTSDLDPEQIYASYTNRLVQQNNYSAPAPTPAPDRNKLLYYGANSTTPATNYYSQNPPNGTPTQINIVPQISHNRLPPQRYNQTQNIDNSTIYQSSNHTNFVSQPIHQSPRPQRLPPPPRYNSVNNTQFVSSPQYMRSPRMQAQSSNQIRNKQTIQRQSDEELMQNIPPLTPIERLSKNSGIQINTTPSSTPDSNTFASSTYNYKSEGQQAAKPEINFSSSYEQFLTNRPSSAISMRPSSMSSSISSSTPPKHLPSPSFQNGVIQNNPSSFKLEERVQPSHSISMKTSSTPSLISSHTPSQPLSVSSFTSGSFKNILKLEDKIEQEQVKNENSLRDFLPQIEAKAKELEPSDDVKEEKVSTEVHESDCLEAFQDPNIGGIALALPHGSILIEVAKHELHATTALKNPNRHNPCRIGLVFYQHKNLHHASHGAGEFLRKNAIREHRDYIQWLKGCFVPSQMKLGTMQKAGFCFPDNVITVKPKDESKPEDRFHPAAYPNFVPGKYVDGKFVKIDVEKDHSYEIFKSKLVPEILHQELSCPNGSQEESFYNKAFANSSSSSNFNGQSLFNNSEQSLTSSLNFYSE